MSKPTDQPQQLRLELKPGLTIASDNLRDPALLHDFPFDKVYAVARKEASRKKPVFFIHRYFARRVTCNVRLALLSLLLPPSEDVWGHFYESASMAPDDSVSVLDPFMGGGTIVFEALRLGAVVGGSDLQPLSRLVTYAEIAEAPDEAISEGVAYLERSVASRIKGLYKTRCPDCGEQADVMYCFWVKTSPCLCDEGCERLDLYSSYRLATKKGVDTILCPACEGVYQTQHSSTRAHCPRCGFIVESPGRGVVTRGKAACARCGMTAFVRDLNERADESLPARLAAQEYVCPHCESHSYKGVSREDLALYEEAERRLAAKRPSLPLPWQRIPAGYNTRQMMNHGYAFFHQMFNARQLLCLGELLAAIDECPVAEARPWLLVAFSAALEMNNMFCRYQHNAWKICNIFFNHAYVPVAMPVENNVWGAKLGTGTFTKSVAKLLRAKGFARKIYDIAVDNQRSARVFSDDSVMTRPVDEWGSRDRTRPFITQADAKSLTHVPTESVDIVLTDPPYGANIMYSELIDFFHVWLHQSVTGRDWGFGEPYSPKTDEIVVNPGHGKSYEDYARGLSGAFSEAARVLKTGGYLVFTFHESTLQGWMSVLRAIRSAPLRLTCAYPIHSESRTGAHTSNKRSIAFDMLLVCTKTQPDGDPRPDDLTRHPSFADARAAAFERAREYLGRLEAVSAELTTPDLENICLALFFAALDRRAGLKHVRTGDLEAEARALVNEIEDALGEVSVVEKRSGWWSRLYGANS